MDQSAFCSKSLIPVELPLWSSLKDAADQAVKVISGIADENNTQFAATIDEISPRAT